MRCSLLLISAASVLAISAQAQDRTSTPAPSERPSDCPDVGSRTVHSFSFSTGRENRAALGIATNSGGARDTLGVLVTEVTADGPADKAGIEEGDRLQMVNATDLRLSSADAGDREMRGLMVRRLVRVLDKLKPGDAVELRIYSDGKTRTVKVTTVKASEVFRDQGVFGFSGDWPASTVAFQLGPLQDRLETLGSDQLGQIEDQIGDLRRNLGSFHFDIAPGLFELDAPPIPPAPPASPAPPDIPRRMLRIGAPPSPPPGSVSTM